MFLIIVSPFLFSSFSSYLCCIAFFLPLLLFSCSVFLSPILSLDTLLSLFFACAHQHSDTVRLIDSPKYAENTDIQKEKTCENYNTEIQTVVPVESKFKKHWSRRMEQRYTRCGMPGKVNQTKSQRNKKYLTMRNRGLIV